jgi:hypothetical protein
MIPERRPQTAFFWSTHVWGANGGQRGPTLRYQIRGQTLHYQFGGQRGPMGANATLPNLAGREQSIMFFPLRGNGGQWGPTLHYRIWPAENKYTTTLPNQGPTGANATLPNFGANATLPNRGPSGANGTLPNVGARAALPNRGSTGANGGQRCTTKFGGQRCTAKSGANGGQRYTTTLPNWGAHATLPNRGSTGANGGQRCTTKFGGQRCTTKFGRPETNPLCFPLGGPTGANGGQRYTTELGRPKTHIMFFLLGANGGQWGPTLHYRFWLPKTNPLCFSLRGPTGANATLPNRGPTQRQVYQIRIWQHS